ncbi:MAG: hypothetical protein JWR10_1379, partial [Rubritepida sp.]|nr:hypothetical protein [Rubritepida sp.]
MILARRILPLLALAPLLGACQVVPQIVGAGAAVTTGALTSNPAVGIAVGLGVTAATDVAVKYYGRSRQDATQDAIASAAGVLEPGGEAPWRTDHSIPIGNEHGEVHLIRAIA